MAVGVVEWCQSKEALNDYYGMQLLLSGLELSAPYLSSPLESNELLWLSK